jgi:tRNA(adenine34) deaminase
LLLSTAEKLKLTPAQCALVGDTVHDATSCRRSGALMLGVESGGNSAIQLLEAGARAVWKDAGKLAQDLDRALQLASPLRIHLTSDKLNELMAPALEAAREGLEAGEAPIGAALFNGDGELLASGYNEMQSTGIKTAHAEMVTFARAAGKAPLDAKDLILVSTLEPCVMCTAAAMEAGVDTVIFGLEAPYDSGSQRVLAPRSPESRMPRLVGHIRAAESRQLLEEYLCRTGETPQNASIRQLLRGQSE